MVQSVTFGSDSTSGANFTATLPTFRTAGLWEESRGRATPRPYK